MFRSSVHVNHTDNELEHSQSSSSWVCTVQQQFLEPVSRMLSHTGQHRCGPVVFPGAGYCRVIFHFELVFVVALIRCLSVSQFGWLCIHVPELFTPVCH